MAGDADRPNDTIEDMLVSSRHQLMATAFQFPQSVTLEQKILRGDYLKKTKEDIAEELY